MTTLAELRQASLKEQKQKEQQNAPEPAQAVKPAEAVTVAPPVAPANGTAPVAHAKTNGHHAPSPEVVLAAPAAVAAPVSPTPAPPSPKSLRAEKYFVRLHETLSHKTLHPSGAKVSADMPPALFHRAKRYCLDHGNITLRQVLIDLLTSYLEEEGY